MAQRKRTRTEGLAELAARTAGQSLLDTKSPSETGLGAENVSDTKRPQGDETSDLELAKQTLRLIMLDGAAPAAARAQASRSMLELIGALGRSAKPAADSDKPLNEMSRAELEAELAALAQ